MNSGRLVDHAAPIISSFAGMSLPRVVMGFLDPLHGLGTPIPTLASFVDSMHLLHPPVSGSARFDKDNADR